MKYKAGQRRRAAEYEPALVEWWKKNKTFEKSVEQRPIDNSYVFYDGPPFITGMPHHGTLLSSIVKDAVPRYWTMRGKHVERRWGWDCHGLPAENFVEKQLGITDRREIGTKWSLEDYILKAKESMVANSETWEGTIDRIGRWVDFQGAYRTMNKEFMESVWWAFKTLYEAGKIYEGAKVLMYDTKFATPVSKSEVTMDNDAYQEVTDPSAFVKFRLIDASVKCLFSGHDVASARRCGGCASSSSAVASGDPRKENLADAPLAYTSVSSSELFATNGGRAKRGVPVTTGDDEAGSEKNTEVCTNETVVYLLAWTTTPWTLAGNMALAVNPEMEYGAYDTGDGKVFVVLASKAEELQKKLEQDWTELARFKGKELVGLSYEPLAVADGTKLVDWRKFEKNYYPAKAENAHKVWGAEFVSDGDGTGIVHIAPAYGEDDYELGKKNGVPCIDVLDEYGCYLPGADAGLKAAGVRPNEEGQIQIWEANKFIAKCLEENGPIEWIEYIKHEYPFNPRSKQRIMYRAFPSWFFDIQGQKELMLEQNENINWFPEYLKHGRFAKNIEQAPDWNLSRDRFWATAMPVWKGDKGTVKVVGSYAELKELSGVELEDYHRPWVDEIEFDLPVQSTEVKAVIFDYADVIGGGVIPGFLKKYPEVAESIRNKFIQEFDFGTVDYDGMCREIAEIAGVSAELIDEQMREISAGLEENAELLKYVLDLRKRGYKTGLLTNTGPMLDLKMPESERKKYFDDSVLSCDVHVTKPASEIYELAANRLGVKPEECVFIDDSEKNVRGAEQVGMQGVVFVGTKNAIDAIEKCLETKKESDEIEHFKRIEKVLDCWFESGSMPFAQLHYPFENKEKFERNYPADFIVEYVGQVRAWFYYVHTVNTALAEVGGFGEKAQARAEKNAFKNVITTGTLAGNDGRKMSKSLGNYTDPNVLMDQYSADALRFLLLSSPVLSGEDFALTDKDVSDVQRKLAMIWNVYDFFVTYASVDGWENSEGSHWQGELKNPLDKWIIARLHELKRDVTAGMEEYNIPKALVGVLPFVDDLSNWFVRRSRRRFWKSEDDDDKVEAYWTLWKVLTKLAQVLAPFTPFLAEELWQNMIGDWNPENSVHLTDWTEAGEIDEQVLEQMARVREVINEGLMLRMRKSDTEEQVKVRQPLARLVYAGEALPDWGVEIVKDEVNVKAVEQGEETWIDKELTEKLRAEGFVRELIRAVQAARKKAGLQVDDRIRLSVSCEVPAEWRETVMNEVLATELEQGQNYAYDEIAKVAGENTTISLEKAQYREWA